MRSRGLRFAFNIPPDRTRFGVMIYDFQRTQSLIQYNPFDIPCLPVLEIQLRNERVSDRTKQSLEEFAEKTHQQCIFVLRSL